MCWGIHISAYKTCFANYKLKRNPFTSFKLARNILLAKSWESQTQNDSKQVLHCGLIVWLKNNYRGNKLQEKPDIIHPDVWCLSHIQCKSQTKNMWNPWYRIQTSSIVSLFVSRKCLFQCIRSLQCHEFIRGCSHPRYALTLPVCTLLAPL